MSGPMYGLEYYNQKMLTMNEHWDDFILDRVMKHPNIWHDRIPRGSYKLFGGLSQKSNIFRGIVPVQAGLSTWKKVGVSRKPTQASPIGQDTCSLGTPQTYSYAWETVMTEGYSDDFQSEPVCLNDLKYVDYAKEQLSMIVRSGVEFGVSMLENWNRETYVYQAVRAGRTMILCEGALQFEDNSTYRFSYDPFAVDSDGDSYITFSVSTSKISTLNWTFLDYLRTTLADRAGQAAMSSEGGMPVFGIMLDLLDFERYVLEDDARREDFRYAKAQGLIEGYGMGFRVYRGFALIHDARQMRYKVHTVSASGVVTAKRVKPIRAGRAVTIGNVPEPNPEYYRAELGIGIVWMNDVFTNLFDTPLANLGSGMTFGPMPGFNGEWQWINIRENNYNQLGETGYFYGRYRIWPKPGLFSTECTVFLYRRCPHAIVTGCEIQTRADVADGAVMLSATPVAGDFDGDNTKVTLTLASKIDVAIGQAVTIKKDNAATFTAYVLEDSDAPTYVFGWKLGDTAVPTAVTEINDPTIVTVTA